MESSITICEPPLSPCENGKVKQPLDERHHASMSHRINLSIPEDADAALQHLADFFGETKQTLARIAINHWIVSHQHEAGGRTLPPDERPLKPRFYRFNIYVSEEVASALKCLAQREGEGQQTLIRQAIDKLISLRELEVRLGKPVLFHREGEKEIPFSLLGRDREKIRKAGQPPDERHSPRTPLTRINLQVREDVALELKRRAREEELKIATQIREAIYLLILFKLKKTSNLFIREDGKDQAILLGY